MMIDRKSQAALEFIMTYGWAILVVLVAIGALAYFGVLSPDRFLPAKCTLQSGLACLDHRVQAAAGAGGVGLVTVRIHNALGFDVENTIVRAGDCGNSGTGVTMANGEARTFSITCNATLTGTRFNEQLNVTYRITETQIDHNNPGQLTARIE
jgi:hypothetical protein